MSESRKAESRRLTEKFKAQETVNKEFAIEIARFNRSDYDSNLFRVYEKEIDFKIHTAIVVQEDEAV